jgi:hypothetical protein
VLFGSDAQLVVEGVVPDLLHIIPVGNDSVLNGVLEGQDTTLGLGLITDIRVLAHADHHSLVARATHDGGKDGAGSIVTSETRLAHTGAVVHHQSLNFTACFFSFTHCSL